MIGKIIIAVLALLVVIFAQLTFNIAFLVWPTFINDHEITISNDTIEKLNNLKIEKKFLESHKAFYPGAPDEATRVEIESLLNVLIQDIINGVPKNPRKSFILKTIKSNMPHFDKYDSEEKDRFGRYCEEILEIMGIGSSERLINVWRYGIPL